MSEYKGPCGSQLMAADMCVQSDPGSCSCFTQPFMDSFHLQVGSAYKTTLAFEIPGSEWFCPMANDNVCVFIENSASCCCTTEVHNFIDCSFQSDWNPSFGVDDCSFDKCGLAGGGDDGGGGGGSMMIIIIAVVVVLLCCCCAGGGLYYRRRKRNAATKTDAASNDVSDALVLVWRFERELVHSFVRYYS
jgi:hypothetical protein